MYSHSLALLIQKAPITDWIIGSFDEWAKDMKANPARYALVVAVIAAIVGIINLFLTHIWPRLISIYDAYSLRRQLGESFTNREIKDSLWYYIEPFAQSMDPSSDEEPQATVNVKSNLFTVLDELFSEESRYRHIIMLADSGMGKTSALMNYTARHTRRLLKKHKVKLIPLSRPGVDEKIKQIENKRDTVLLLDALDEDTLAIENHHQRLRDIMKATYEFRRVLISCRAQFFLKDEEIPQEAGIMRAGTRAAGQSATYTLHKIYLSPFTKKQATLYLRRRYPLVKFRWLRRWRAFRMTRKIQHLAARPMLLAHIDALIGRDKDINYSYEIYEEMVCAWLDREEGFLTNKEDMRRFSELLAVDLFINREKRQEERIPYDQLTMLARSWDIPIEEWNFADWQLRTRALLNRDAAGNYKFAHRSILEYLFVKRFAAGDNRCLMVEWTDQMRAFYWELLEHQLTTQRRLWFYNDSDPRANEFSDEHESFFKRIILYGLAQLETPIIASKRMNTILETATALCGFVLDPYGKDDPVLSLIKVQNMTNGEYTLNYIAIYYHGKLLDTKDTEGLRRYSYANDLALYSDSIPNVDSDNYTQILGKLKRVDKVEGGLHSIAMPIKKWGTAVGILIGETTKRFAFEDNRQYILLDALILMGKYLWDYRKE
jgi:hypothetical protein